MKDFFMPSVSKIITYFILFFIMPTYYYVCSSGVCNIQISFFVIINLLYNKDFGTLTFPGMILLIALSYFMACVIVRAAKPFFRERK